MIKGIFVIFLFVCNLKEERNNEDWREEGLKRYLNNLNLRNSQIKSLFFLNRNIKGITYIYNYLYKVSIIKRNYSYGSYMLEDTSERPLYLIIFVGGYPFCGREEKLEFIARKRQSFRHQIINGSSATVCVRQETALPIFYDLGIFFSSTSFPRIMRRTGIKKKRKKEKSSDNVSTDVEIPWTFNISLRRINCNRKLSNVSLSSSFSTIYRRMLFRSNNMNYRILD